MFSRLKNNFGIPGVIGVIALVFAMFGGAYAASSSGGGSKATAAAKGKRGARGPKGATGPAGPQGAPGAKGDAGAAGGQGAAGKDGTNGTNGTPGTNGTSITNTAEPTGTGNCEGRGGAKFAVGAGSPTFACNGKEGQQGIPGTPGTTGFTETLPSTKTETGEWFISHPVNVAAEFGEGLAPVAFPIPLTAAAATTVSSNGVEVMHKADGSPPTNCTGGSLNEPKANPGYLCVYIGEASQWKSAQEPVVSFKADFATPGVNTSGTLLYTELKETGYGSGTWAVTAP